MKPILILFMLLFAATAIHAQQVVASSGNSGTAVGYKVDWTLGEPAIETITGANNILTQGMHQTRLLITSLIDLEFPGLEISVFPNPTHQWLNIAFNHVESIKLSYQLYDISGRHLLQKVMFSETEIIDMKYFVPNIYILKIVSEDGLSLQVFKIIKN
jgi:hypothetical protein